MREAPFGLYKVCQKIIKVYLIVFKRYKIVNKSNFPLSGSVLVCGNHLSNSDCLYICADSPKLVNWTSKPTLFKFKPFGALLRYFGAFPVKPRFCGEQKAESITLEGEQNVSAIEHSMNLLKQDRYLGLFPEGHRKKTWQKHGYRVRSGAGVLAIETNCQVVPVGIIGGEKLFQKTIMIVGEPIKFEKQPDKEYTREDYIEVSKDILRESYKLIGECPPFDK